MKDLTIENVDIREIHEGNTYMVKNILGEIFSIYFHHSVVCFPLIYPFSLATIAIENRN
jgi:hypothetical protein